MKSMRISFIVSLTLATVAACDDGPADPGVHTEDQSVSAPRAAGTPPHYLVLNLRSLGGTSSGGNSLGNLGIVGGTSNLAGDTVVHATIWILGFPVDLGTLGGPSSGIIWPVKNNLGILSGIAETDEDQPLGEEWSCDGGFLPDSGKVCKGFVYEGGHMRALPTLGGANAFATGTNNHRQTAGWSERDVADPTCNPPQVENFRAVVWGPGRDQIRELPPLGDDTTSAATGLNDRGQVIGISGICSNAVGELSAIHAVMWQDGRIIDMGDIGGKAWNTPMALNQRGDVVGFANLAGTVPENAFNAHAFFWTAGQKMQDLEVLDGDLRSQALGINERDQIVGLSTGGANGTHAVLWLDGKPFDLNAYKAPGSTKDVLRVAGDINDFGVITGQSVAADKSRSTFIAIPIGP